MCSEMCCYSCRDSNFNNNTAEYAAAMLCQDSSNASIHDSIFLNNTASVNGGGLTTTDNARVCATNFEICNPTWCV